MLNVERDILSLTDFKRKTNEILLQMQQTGSPVVLTVNGKAEIVVQDARSFQAMQERLERLDAIEGVHRGLEQMARGEGRPAAEVFAEFREKHNLASA
jgi:prevent-host-death family protein